MTIDLYWLFGKKILMKMMIILVYVRVKVRVYKSCDVDFHVGASSSSEGVDTDVGNSDYNIKCEKDH